ncbi:hypothetical protein VHUM_00128 [Vanrija humicola]|uniref:WW domain-containing protein n=1 Tax=Vanrija humicola TaxID=5417 RepID=A0A7D8ZHJ0_VANHU|nr:hypothetical protein VHUM_00128 [Vanrija humicola]
MPPKKSKKQAAPKEPQEGDEGWVPPLPSEPAPPLPVETAPPLPAEQPPLPTEQPPLPEAQPVTELGGDDDDEGDGDGDDGDDGDDKDKGADAPTPADKGKGKADPSAWQAVWSPERNAYYFWNTATDEVTWVNPLAPASDGPPLPNEPAPASAGSSSSLAPRAAPTTAPEMDPGLAFLLPPEARTVDGSSAMFNARTGRFTPVDYSYSVHHLDEWNRAKRMSERFFDVEGWEKQKAAENAKRKADEAAGIVRETKITKKDMDRFRKKKAEHKAKRQAWLYD